MVPGNITETRNTFTLQISGRAESEDLLLQLPWVWACGRVAADEETMSQFISVTAPTPALHAWRGSLVHPLNTGLAPS